MKIDFDNNDVFQTTEEIANAITHGLGAALSICAIVLLIIFSHGNPVKLVSTIIYSTTLFILYISSTLYHSITHKKTKYVFEIFDHASIYLLIAGTYTPFSLITLKGTLGWVIFSVVWILAILGIIYKIFFVKKFVIFSTLLYIAMGWLIIFALKPLSQNLNSKGMIFLFAGGILYTLGTIFYIWRKLPYHHAIWHIFVLGGSILHFFAILSI
ncbi:PAQR family membrane homeostasis protein TrhA [Thermosipho atlanticus]|uniref:Hemolysin III n=1 Tax=Thermosipho atlanticus DSM 15807 TaxID=1123380 RepID=A0A1M5T517_9BACT|nr:hemolysin III family protein [Thermosipho atlanticus]SHH45847.1 hemolysin III [Thermosipho atlanticus DSM 15807]